MKITQKSMVLEMTEKEYDAILHQLNMNFKHTSIDLEYAKGRVPIFSDCGQEDRLEKAKNHVKRLECAVESARKALRIFEGKEEE